MAYEDALRELYQVPLTQFVAERKRLADELKAGGDAAAAKRLTASKRPPISAWVVNQLYWHARDAFDEMLATAEQLRKGHLKASGDHRDAIAKLRKRAATILEDAGHAATESTLRRVTTTLSALAATGGFDPDLPGALQADRDPPGFEAVGIPSSDEAEPAARPEPKPKAKAKQADGKAELDDARDTAEQQRLAEMAEKKREEEARKRKAAERHRLEAALRTARGDLDARERTIKQLEKQLEKAREDLIAVQDTIGELDARIAELDAD